MTTIAASAAVRMVAADSAATLDDDKKLHRDRIAVMTNKLVRVRGSIFGVAGPADLTVAFLEWKSGRRKRVPGGKGLGWFYAIELTRAGELRLYAGTVTDPDVVKDGLVAVGSGASVALGALEAMREVGVAEDPRLAVMIASRRDPNTKPPIDFLTWRGDE